MPLGFCCSEFLMRLSTDFPPVFNAATPVVPPSTDTNVTTTPTPTVTRAPGSDDPFTLFNTNTSYGFNSLISSAAKKLQREERDASQYIG